MQARNHRGVELPSHIVKVNMTWLLAT